MVKIRIKYYSILEGNFGVWLADSIKFDRINGGFIVRINGKDFKFTNGYVNLLEIDMIQL